MRSAAILSFSILLFSIVNRGNVVLNAQTGKTEWTFTSLQLFADFNDGSAPAPGSMSIGVWGCSSTLLFFIKPL